MASIEGDGNNRVVAHISKFLYGAYAKFFVDDDIAGIKKRR